MFPLLLETESLVPGDSPSGVLDIQDRNDFFVQAPELIGGHPYKRLSAGERPYASSAAASSKTSVCRSTSASVVAGDIRAMLWNGVRRIPRLSV